MRARLAQLAVVFRALLANPELRRVELAFVGFNAAEWGVWIAMLVYAYDHGGATTAGLVALLQLAPAAVFAPVAAALGDRRPPARVLAVGYVLQAAAMGAVAAALLAGARPLVAYALAAVAATAVTVTRPAQAALLPGLARTPDELTAANVVSGWVESLSVLAAPALAGVILGVGSPGIVFAVMAAVALGSALLVARLRGPGPAIGLDGGGAFREALGGFRALADERASRVLVAVLGVQFVTIGALDVLFVVLALGLLDMGQSGAGYLNAAFGAGGVVGVAATAALVGRRHLVPPLLLGCLVWSAAFAALGARPTTIGAVLLLAGAGVGRTLLDVAGRTLLQRVAPEDVRSRVFGVLEGISMAGLAIGSLLAPALVALGGARLGILGVGALPLLVAAGLGRRLRRIDEEARTHVVEIALLRSLPIFAALPAPTLESLARSVEPLEVPAGAVVVRQGDRGDRFYAVAEGELEASVDDRPVAALGRGDGFGEIALLHEVPRTATVAARTHARLLGLAKEPFLAAVTGHPRTERAAAGIVSRRLASTADP